MVAIGCGIIYTRLKARIYSHYEESLQTRGEWEKIGEERAYLLRVDKS